MKNIKSLNTNSVKALRKSGLFVSEPFPAGHYWEDGVIVGKPTATKGNFIPEFKFGYEEIDMDAPDVILFSDGNHWYVVAQEGVPGPAEGDFTNKWNCEEEAVADILDYYFGSPDRMKAKEIARKKFTEGWT